jgi:hypothetical protein
LVVSIASLFHVSYLFSLFFFIWHQERWSYCEVPTVTLIWLEVDWHKEGKNEIVMAVLQFAFLLAFWDLIILFCYHTERMHYVVREKKCIMLTLEGIQNFWLTVHSNWPNILPLFQNVGCILIG